MPWRAQNNQLAQHLQLRPYRWIFIVLAHWVSYSGSSSFWGDASCWGTRAAGREGLFRWYTWCCLSFVKQFIGHPQCWERGPDDPAGLELSFERCCYVPTDISGSGRKVLLSEGTRTRETQEPTSPHKFSFNFQHELITHIPSLSGCSSTRLSDEVFFAFKLKGGCITCSTSEANLYRYMNISDVGCLAGKMLVTLTAFLAEPEATLGNLTAQARALARDASRILETVEMEVQLAAKARGLNTVALFFDIFGATPVQIRYVLWHTSFQDDYDPIFDFASETRNLFTHFNSTDAGSTGIAGVPLMFDIGMSGGMDSLFYLIHGFRVVAVEANPLVTIDVRGALSRFGSRLRVISAAVTDDDEAGKDQQFHIHRSRADFSSLDASRVPLNDRAGTFLVGTVSCAQLAARFGRPFGVKIDAEGADRVCLRSLSEASALPPYVSSELPNLLKEGCDEGIELVELLASMGYKSFKMCRQTIWNARLVVAEDQTTGERNIMVSRQSAGLGASGPFGEAAVDYLHGPRWRGPEQLIAEMKYGGPIWASSTMGDWFDVHARL